ncbi:MAG: glycosyltransferase family 1 protein [Sphingobacteriaceae bacterium]|nr:MAG: glycosyltransferase family 1 protein [Sphingobacteriaceae bacterium]
MIYINGRFLTQKLSGTQRFAYEVVKELYNYSSVEVTVLVPPVKFILKDYDTRSFKLKVIGKYKNLLWEQIDLLIYLKLNKNPLLINLINTAPVIYKNQIITIHDMTTFIKPEWFSKLFSQYYRIILPIIARNSLKIITVSENSRSDITKILEVPAHKVVVLYNSISEIFYKNKSSSNNLINKFKIEKNNFILAVSSLDPRKNFKRLIKAYYLIDQAMPLVIVGTTGKAFANDNLKHVVNNINEVIFTGYVNDEELAELYSFARCFIYPSLYEGFGVPPLEAMACGCSTIVSNGSSLPEVCGDASLYIDPLSIPSINNALLNLINNENLRKELVAKGREQVKRYSWKQTTQKLLETIEHLYD